MLLKMPGVDSKNVHRLMNQVENICELVELSEERLNEILENKHDARQLYQFLHAEHLEPVASTSAKSKTGSSSRFLDFRSNKRKRLN